MFKSPKLYRSLLVLWSVLAIFFLWVVIREYSYVELDGIKAIIVNVLLTLNGLFIMYFWLNGMKDIVYVGLYFLRKEKLLKKTKTKLREEPAKVVLVYCTCDDFEPKALKKSMEQTCKCETVILDDSNSQKYQRRVDRFADKHNVKVVRRSDKTGFKAGNLNNYLAKAKWDYFVILDSDEIIPKNFCKKALGYFETFDSVGIVQGNHKATRNRTKFMGLFHIGVNSHWPTYQLTKTYYGFASLLGHGAMVSRECYEAVGGIPETVAEDLCFSIEARNNGFYTVFAPDIMCQEEYPVDYLAFKKRHNKWTQGNMEFIRTYTGKILKSKMRWFEKLDIFLFAYNLPLTAFFSFYILTNIMLFPLLGYSLHYPAWLLIPTIVFFFAPMLNDVITWFRKIKLRTLIKYLIMTFLLYGSVLFVSIKASFLGLFGRKAVFLVTPKQQQNIRFLEALKVNWQEIAFAGVMSGISLLCCGSILPVILIVIPALASVYLSMYSNQ